MNEEHNDKPETFVDRVKATCKTVKRNSLVVFLIFILGAIIYLGGIFDAITKIKNFVSPPSHTRSVGEADQTPTAENRVGIWVARIRGDDDQYSAQRELVQNLRFYLGKESALENLVDVRELAQEVTGATESEKEILARQLGQRVNAAIVIWGEIASPLKKGIFPPSNGSFRGPILLNILSEAGFRVFSPA